MQFHQTFEFFGKGKVNGEDFSPSIKQLPEKDIMNSLSQRKAIMFLRNNLWQSPHGLLGFGILFVKLQTLV